MSGIGDFFGGMSAGDFKPLLSTIPTVLNSVGQVSQYSGQRQIAAGQDLQANAYTEIGQRRATIAEIEAKQHEANALQEVASSQRTGAEDQRQARLAASRALAVAAASGGGASDPTVVSIISRIAGEGTYRSMTDLYNGEVAAKNQLQQAQANRYEGSIAQLDAQRAAAAAQARASNTRSNANINALTGIGKSLYDKYGKDIDPSKSTSDGEYTNATDLGLYGDSGSSYTNATDLGFYD
jgi:hypothetical protein